MTKASSPVPRATWIVALLLGAVLNLPAGQAAAQGSPLCFTQPGITNCISGRFLQFWQQNGGLPAFGYPITPQAPEQTPEGTFTVQYFERERFELQPNNPAPYDVLLGRLGDQLLQRQGIDWTTLPRADPSAPNYFPETGHAISTPQFFQYWSSNGLKDPTLSPYQHSLALFGLPLTEAYMTTNSSGDNVLTQWFERARFEYHPTNPPEFQVLLGLLGNEWRAAPPPPPPPPPGTGPNGCTLAATVVGDLTIPPGAQIDPGAAFEKVWQVRNDGNCTWDGGYQIVFAGGNQMSGPNAGPIPATSPGQTVNIDVDLIAPSAQGPASGTWQLRASNGVLFGTLTVSIVINPPPP